jgi:Ca2+-binding EF-hand superfamily protein
VLTIADLGRGLFDVLDTDHDGRLGVREMRNAIKLLDTHDRNGDKQFSRDEIPRSYPLTIGVGEGNPFQGRAVVPRAMATRSSPAGVRRAGPVWFQKMDRNRDGDVSRREFLGTDAAFAKLDADRDGLISREEAEQADARLRTKQSSSK